MHEMSIAEALLEQVRRHTPAGQRAHRVRVEAGPLQAIDPQALAWAWQAMTSHTELEGARLDYCALPFHLACAHCGREWESPEAFESCACGAPPRCQGSAELRLISLEVEPLDLDGLTSQRRCDHERAGC